MLGHTPRKCQGITSISIEWNRYLIPHSRQIWHPQTFPFGYVKGKLMGYRTETPSELLVRIRVTLAEIPRETLNTVFLEWMKRLQKCVQVFGEYV
jgi:hypothetical protein